MSYLYEFLPLILGIALPATFLVGFGVGHYAFGRPEAIETEARHG